MARRAFGRSTASSADGACGSTTSSSSLRCCCSPPPTLGRSSVRKVRRSPRALVLDGVRPRLPVAARRAQHPRLRRGKWLQNIGGISSWLPAAMVIAAGAVSCGCSARRRRSRRRARPARRSVDDAQPVVGDVLRLLGVRNRIVLGPGSAQSAADDPRGMLIAGVIITLIYIAGTLAVLVAVPADGSRSAGASPKRWRSCRRGSAGSAWARSPARCLRRQIAGTSAWAAGAARVSFAAGLDRVMPEAMARLHPRYRTPHVALIVQASSRR